jgi:hypothetical protein
MDSATPAKQQTVAMDSAVPAKQQTVTIEQESMQAKKEDTTQPI